MRFDRMVLPGPGSVGPLRRELRRFARAHGASSSVQAAVALTFAEACAAIIGRGAAPGTAEEPLSVEASVRGDWLELRVSTRAPALPPAPDEPGYGFSLALISQMTECFEVRRRDTAPGTTMVMTFRLAPERRPERSSPRPRSRS